MIFIRLPFHSAAMHYNLRGHNVINNVLFFYWHIYRQMIHPFILRKDARTIVEVDIILAKKLVPHFFIYPAYLYL